MSASMTPTLSPCAASAAARFAVMEDLPTPPLPEVTAMTRVRESGGRGDFALGATTVELLAQRLLLVLVHDAHLDGDVLDAVEGTHTLGDVLVIWVRSGHPAVVSRTLTATEERRW